MPSIKTVHFWNQQQQYISDSCATTQSKKATGDTNDDHKNQNNKKKVKRERKEREDFKWT